MPNCNAFLRSVSVLLRLVQDAVRFLLLGKCSKAALRAENLFLRKQLALYLERKAKPRRAQAATRLTLVLLSALFAWQEALVIVKPGTLIRWHRKAFQLFWRWKSRPRGRPRLPADLRALIAEIARSNPTWGEERIAAELLLKLGVRVSPRTVRRYLPENRGSGSGPTSQRWMTFAHAILACDLFTVVTASFRVLYVFVILEVGTHKIAHCNVTAHPRPAWMLQQFREVITGEGSQRFLIHDRDRIFSTDLDSALHAMDLEVLKTPFETPQANAFCEQVIGTMRRECLDFLIPLNERHLRAVLKEWVAHYNRGRPHSSLGPGIPDPRACSEQAKPCGHRIAVSREVVARAILGGLHHEYRLERRAA